MRIFSTIGLLIVTGCYSEVDHEYRKVVISDAYSTNLNAGLAAADKKDYQAAVESFTHAIKAKETPAALSNRGLAFHRLGKYDRSRADHDRAIELDPNDAGSYVNRAVLFAAMGEIPKAMTDLDKALELDETNGHALAHRGRLSLTLGQHKSARDDLSQAFELGCSDANDLNALAWLLATCPDDSIRDGAKAVELASLASLASGADWGCVETLAAALAESGKFDEAVENQKLAIESAPEDQRAAMRERMELYQQGKAFRLP